MSSLVISDAGLNIKGLPAKLSNSLAANKAIALTLSDGVIEEMIQCVQNGNSIQLSLDNSPSISYGVKTQHLSISNDSSTHEVFRTNSQNAVRSLSKTGIPHPPPNAFVSNLKINSTLAAIVGQKFFAPNPPVVNSPVSDVAVSTNDQGSEIAGADAALAALQSSLATESMRKAENTVKYIKDGSLTIPSKRGSVMKSTNQISSSSQYRKHNDEKKNLPPSPSVVPLSQQQAEQSKTARKPVIHLLAVSPMTFEDLEDKMPAATTHGLKQALQKVGDLNESTGKWELRKAFFKELDVWTFKYEDSKDRKQAIDNAVKIFDKMRLNVSEPQWERLLPRNERGSGKCLSKLQAQIAQTSSQQKAPNNSNNNNNNNNHNHSSSSSNKGIDSGHESTKLSSNRDDDGGSATDKMTTVVTKLKGESTSRLSSQNSTSKSKKVSGTANIEKEIPAKRLLGKKTNAASKSSQTTKIVSSKKSQSSVTAETTTTTKTTTNSATTSKDGKLGTNYALSSEYVQSSDEEDSPTPIAPLPKQLKRQRENDEVSESSMSPLKKPSREISLSHQRHSDISRTITTSASQYSFSSKSAKSNSPQKSSPLASSPPTNASDFERSPGFRSPTSISSPRSGTASRSPINKSQTKPSSVSRKSDLAQRRLRPEVTDLARKYKMYYPKYLELHEQLTGMGDRRDRRMEKDLLEMHARLDSMKKEILAGIVDVNCS